jgi:hypothetical protein
MANTSMIKIYNESYWHVDGVRYKNKFKALESAGNDINSVGFYYANPTFDDLDWTKEPSQSWDSMLIQRAHQVRESFNYIRLWYSAGSDSQTMLNVFLNEGIHIDEICCHLVSPIDDFNASNNIEQNKVALPFLDSIKSSMPKTKITINYLGREHFNKILTDDWLYEGFDISMIQDQPDALYNTGVVTEVGENFCDLQGGDKPVLIQENNDYYCLMVDETFGARINSEHLEEFFITPNFPEMQVKQCHMSQNYLKETYPNQEPGVIKGVLRKEIEQKTGMRHPLYKDIDQGKETNSVVGNKSSSLLEQAKQANPEVYNKYIKFLEYEANRYTDRFNNGDLYQGFRGILSGRYKLS